MKVMFCSGSSTSSNADDGSPRKLAVQPLVTAVRPTIVDRSVLPLDYSLFGHAFAKCIDKMRRIVSPDFWEGNGTNPFSCKKPNLAS